MHLQQEHLPCFYNFQINRFQTHNVRIQHNPEPVGEKFQFWPHDSAARWECQNYVASGVSISFCQNTRSLFRSLIFSCSDFTVQINTECCSLVPSCSLQNRIQTETWGTRPAILFKLIGPDTDEKLLHGKHLETLHREGKLKLCAFTQILFAFLLTS